MVMAEDLSTSGMVQRDGGFIGCNKLVQLCAQRPQLLFHEVNVGADEEDTIFLGSFHLVTLDGGDDRIGFFLKGALKEGSVDIRVKRVRSYQIVHNGKSGFSEHVGDDGIKRNITDSESVLAAVLLASVTGNELEAVAGIFPEDADGLIRDKATRDQAEPEKVADPFVILGVILIALDSFDPFGVGDGDIHLSL